MGYPCRTLDKTAFFEPQEDIDILDHQSESTQSDPDRDLFPEERALSDSFFSSSRNPVEQEATSPFQPFELPLPPFPNTGGKVRVMLCNMSSLHVIRMSPVRRWYVTGTSSLHNM